MLGFGYLYLNFPLNRSKTEDSLHNSAIDPHNRERADSVDDEVDCNDDEIEYNKLIKVIIIV